jgi:hypothetical protein
MPVRCREGSSPTEPLWSIQMFGVYPWRKKGSPCLKEEVKQSRGLKGAVNYLVNYPTSVFGSQSWRRAFYFWSGRSFLAQHSDPVGSQSAAEPAPEIPSKHPASGGEYYDCPLRYFRKIER